MSATVSDRVEKSIVPDECRGRTVTTISTIEMFIERRRSRERAPRPIRWHPHAVDIDMDYASEPMTLVEFTLADAPGGTMLTMTESGFDRIPAARRLEAFRMNSDGWAQELQHIERLCHGQS